MRFHVTGRLSTSGLLLLLVLALGAYLALTAGIGRGSSSRKANPQLKAHSSTGPTKRAESRTLVAANSGLTKAPPSTALTGIHVSGNKLVNGSGQSVHLIGVNRSGTEYACIQGWGIFDGPSTAASVRAMASWHTNVVRIPLNEDCWLGINGVKAAYSGANYVKAIVRYVHLLHRNRMYAELSLMWGAPGKHTATYQPGGPDESHSPAMWSSMASTFKKDRNVILAPWGETVTGWTCFMKTGCSNQATYGPRNVGYRTAPMRQAVKVMRAAGYTGVISIPCIDYANQCAHYNGSSWLASHPKDPKNQLIAEAHIYGDNLCGAQNNGACLQRQYGNLAQHVPVIWGETGEDYESNDCKSTNMRVLLPWADAHISGYETWAWDAWGNCGSLVRRYSGTPANEYATYVRSHYAALAALGSRTRTRIRAAQSSLRPLEVSGNTLVASHGKRIILRGVDRSGTEYACIQGWGIFDGPADKASVKAMRAWRINGVNIGLNEDCWLGINGVKRPFGGTSYVDGIKKYVRLLEANGIYPVIGLFWEAPGSKKATGQIAMPDADHATRFWQSVAQTFKADRRVIFRLKEEPFPAKDTNTREAWSCWSKGGSACHEGYPVVGMQSLIKTIRATGAKNVIQVPGVEYANSMARFLAYEPKDPAKNLMAVADVYPELNPCGNVKCYNRFYGPVVKRLPFMAGEFGESVNGNICSVAKSNKFLDWMDAHKSGYFAWTWDTWGKYCGDLSLILSYHGTPKSPNGTNYRAHLLRVVR